MLYKICGKCGKKIAQGNKCSCVKERHKVYDKEFRNKESANFYHSKAWRKLTALCKLKANGLDMWELIVNKRIVKGTLSHHIEELTENKDRALDITNLIWISDKTHNFIHAEYNKSIESKKKLQEKLFSIVNNLGVEG